LIATLQHQDFFKIFDISGLDEIYDLDYKYGPSMTENMLDRLDFNHGGYHPSIIIRKIGCFEIGDDSLGNIIVFKNEEEEESYEEGGLF